ncbi:TRAP transporter small permease [Gelria sp. Kuro-4]|uniref:TRAP transporter small permease n=1 Tax=Gelria sp. Kuro-4 TaxID=2796927 RepID=UPI001C81E9F2|nr:TRAP transporter small permease [Gelria sp. Kuro-4]
MKQEKPGTFLSACLNTGAIVTLTLMVTIVTAQVVMRYVFHHSLSWAEEAARFLLVWVAFLGTIIGLQRKEHISVDAFVSMLPHTIRGVVTAISIVITALFWTFLGWGGLGLWRSAADQVSPAMQLPMSWVYAIIPISGLVLLLISLDHLRQLFRPKGK